MCALYALANFKAIITFILCGHNLSINDWPDYLKFASFGPDPAYTCNSERRTDISTFYGPVFTWFWLLLLLDVLV